MDTRNDNQGRNTSKMEDTGKSIGISLIGFAILILLALIFS